MNVVSSIEQSALDDASGKCGLALLPDVLKLCGNLHIFHSAMLS